MGLATVSGGVTFTYTLAITGVTSASGSKGGADLAIAGSGFHTDSVVTFGGNACTIVGTITTNAITCTLAGNSGEAVKLG
jgi:hypothetical protein